MSNNTLQLTSMLKVYDARNGFYRITLIDTEDYDKLMNFNWNIRWSNLQSNNTASLPYARTKTGTNNIEITLHRHVINVPNNMFVDHINKNTLDNRKENLRIVTKSQNAMNQKKRDGQKYKGICFYHANGKWMAGIKINGKRKHLGYFENDLLAAKAYDKAARELFGEYASLNFPEH